jgi:hypothetical protein
MTFNSREKRSSRTSKLNVECLGERIAPAVYLSGMTHLLALKGGSIGQFEARLKDFQQDGGSGPVNHRLGTIDGYKMSLGMRFHTTAIIVKGPVNPVPVYPVSSPNPGNKPFGAISLNIVKAPVKPVPVVPPVNPTDPVNKPFGALSLNNGNSPVKPVKNPPTPPTPPAPPANKPFAL